MVQIRSDKISAVVVVVLLLYNQQTRQIILITPKIIKINSKMVFYSTIHWGKQPKIINKISNLLVKIVVVIIIEVVIVILWVREQQKVEEQWVDLLQQQPINKLLTIKLPQHPKILPPAPLLITII